MKCLLVPFRWNRRMVCNAVCQKRGVHSTCQCTLPTSPNSVTACQRPPRSLTTTTTERSALLITVLPWLQCKARTMSKRPSLIHFFVVKMFALCILSFIFSSFSFARGINGLHYEMSSHSGDCVCCYCF